MPPRVPEPADTGLEKRAARIRALHEARAAAELAAADAVAPGSDRVAWRGSLLAGVMLVKGLPGPAEASGGAAMSGADGEALGKALEALGWCGTDAFFTLSRPDPDIDAVRRAERLRLQAETVDPQVVVALDTEAAVDLAHAFGLPGLKPGRVAVAGGRRLVAVDGFEASLGDERAKRRVWMQLKHAVPDGPVY